MNKKVKQCIICKKEALPRRKYCYSCLLKTTKEKQKEVYQKRLKKIKSKVEKKIKKKPITLLNKEAWRLTSKIVRLQSDRCYTCDKPLRFKERQAGHFWTSGAHPGSRYDYDNLRVQCVGCNYHKSGNIAEYGVRLLKEIGKKRFDVLNLKAHEPKKWHRDELEQIIEERKKELKELEEN